MHKVWLFRKEYSAFVFKMNAPQVSDLCRSWEASLGDIKIDHMEGTYLARRSEITGIEIKYLGPIETCA